MSRLTRRGAVLASLLALLAVLPFAATTFYTELATKVMILAIFALSLDLLIGCTGLVSFGHAAFFATGAYALALMAPKYEAASLWVTLPAAMLVAGLAALVVGAFVIRARGIYFIMVTLAFAQMFYFVFHDMPFAGGSDGISMNFKPDARVAGFAPFDLGSIVHVYYFVLAVLLAVFVFLRLLLRSTLGRALQGIRSNEHRMLTLGFPVYRYKLASFTIAGTIAGLAGYLAAMQFGFVNPEIASWHQSGNVLVMLILGGIGSLYGAAAGAFAFVALSEIFQAVTSRWQLLLGGTIIALVLVLPGGLASVPRRFRALLLGEGRGPR